MADTVDSPRHVATDALGQDAFASPDPWHRPAAYWFWHEPPDHALIRRQVHEMHDAGIHSFQIQARLSYPLEGYLDDDYLAACTIAVETAAELGMVVGLYDDYNWQSGHAAGRGVSGHDEFRERHLFWVRLPAGDRVGQVSGIRSATASLGPAAMRWHYEGGEVSWTDWQCEYVVVESADYGAADIEIDGHADGCRVRLNGTPSVDADMFVFVSARCATSRLVNQMDSAAVDRFIAVGYEPFARTIGEHFGTTVAYLFFDQPHAVFYDWAERTGQQISAIPFHHSLAEALRGELRDDLPSALAALIGGDSVAARSLRARFYDSFSRHAQRTFLGRVRSWCHDHDLLLSGHEVLGHVGGWNLDTAFSDWDLRVNFGLDHFGVDSYRDLTAVDAQDAVDQLSPVLGDSVARHNGRFGTLVEQYFLTPPEGGAPWSGHWGLTLQELRSTAMTHHLRGMRQMIFHGFYQTHGHDRDHESLANPRFDFPPGVNFEPWFADHHARFAIESARVSEFLEPIQAVTEVAILYPLRTIWSEGQSARQARELGQWSAGLSAAGIPFLLIDERDLADVEVQDGRFRIGRRTFTSAVLPAVTTLRSSATIGTLLDVLAGGAQVIASGPTPAVYQEGIQSAAADWARTAHLALTRDGVPPERELRDLFAQPRDAVTVSFPRGARVRARVGSEDSDAVRAVLFAQDAAEATIDLPPGTWRVEEWDPTSGKQRTIGTASDRVQVDLHDQELRLLRLNRTNLVDLPQSGALEVSSRHSLVASPVTTTLHAGWRLEIPDGAHAYAGTSRPIGVTEGWERQGLPTFAGTADYVCEIPTVTDQQRLVLPAVGGAVEVLLDGELVGTAGWAPYSFVLPARTTNADRYELRVRVSPPAANRFYAGTGLRPVPEPCGLLAPPIIVHNVGDSGPTKPKDDHAQRTQSTSDARTAPRIGEDGTRRHDRDR